MRVGRHVLVVISLLGLSAPAVAQDAAYVAAAYSKTNGVVGFAVGASDDEVRAKALAECRSAGVGDCQVAMSGTNMCVSLARATSKNSLGLGGGASRAVSQREAMNECAVDGAEGCNIHDTYCAPKTIR